MNYSLLFRSMKQVKSPQPQGKQGNRIGQKYGEIDEDTEENIGVEGTNGD